VFVVALLIYWFAKRIYMLAKKIKDKGLSAKYLVRKSLKYLKSERYQFLGSIALVCLLLVLFGTHNEFIVSSSIVGSISLILFPYYERKENATKEISNHHINRGRIGGHLRI